MNTGNGQWCPTLNACCRLPHRIVNRVVHHIQLFTAYSPVIATPQTKQAICSTPKLVHSIALVDFTCCSICKPLIFTWIGGRYNEKMEESLVDMSCYKLGETLNRGLSSTRGRVVGSRNHWSKMRLRRDHPAMLYG